MENEYKALLLIVSGMTAEQILSYREVYAFFKEEFNSELVDDGKESTELYQVISPDGISLSHLAWESPEEAWLEFDEWKKRFEPQGYYSTIIRDQRAQIPLNILKSMCTLSKLDE